MLTTPVPGLATILSGIRYAINPVSWYLGVGEYFGIPKNLSSTWIKWWGHAIKLFNPAAFNNNVQPQSLLQSQQNVRPSFATRAKNGMLRGAHKVLTSSYIPAATEIAILGLGTKMYDDASNFWWAQYVAQNNAYLLELLKGYRKEKETFGDVSKIKDFEVKIKQFIKDGHTQNGLASMVKWANIYSSSYWAMNMMTLLPLAGYCGYRVYKFYNQSE